MGFLPKIFQKKQGERITKTDYTSNDLYSDHKQMQDAFTDIRKSAHVLSEIEILNNNITVKVEELAKEYVNNIKAVKALKEEFSEVSLVMREIDADLVTIAKISARADTGYIGGAGDDFDCID